MNVRSMNGILKITCKARKKRLDFDPKQERPGRKPPDIPGKLCFFCQAALIVLFLLFNVEPQKDDGLLT
jgi:hypothetical protein